MTAACLAAFGVTVPLPRVDDQLIGSDGIRYYVYLPSVLIDGDLDFTDEYRHFYRSHPATASYLIDDRTPTGLPANRFGIGPALLWSPFFIAAHLLAILLQALGYSLEATGYGAWYQMAVLAGSIVYGGLGAWLCFRAARRSTSRNAALAATLLAVLAGNSVYYLTVEPSMSHALSMFASAAFFYAWIISRDRPQWRDRVPPEAGRRSIALGACAGLMALIRPQDGLLLLLPITDEALSAWRAGRGARLWWMAASLSMIATAFLVFTPQLLVWKLLNGGFLHSGYSQEFEILFHWPFSHLLDVLFSAQRGLFTWHPLFLLALAGLVLIIWHSPRRRERRLAALGFSGFVIQWVVISSWHDWSQGDAFGGRMFIVCSPIFVYGLAALLDSATGCWPWRRILIGGAILVLLNLLLLVQYRAQLLGLARPITFMDLAFGRFLLGPS